MSWGRLAKLAVQTSLGRSLKSRSKSLKLKLSFESEIKLSSYWRMAEIEFWWEKISSQCSHTKSRENEIALYFKVHL